MTELERPRWVRLGLWGIRTRHGALQSAWTGTAVVCGLFGGRYFAFTLSRLVLGVGVYSLLAAYWLLASLQWVDRHGRWS